MQKGIHNEIRRRDAVALVAPEIAFPRNWMWRKGRWRETGGADVYVQNYIAAESVASRCYYLIRVDVVCGICRSRLSP